MSHDPDVRVLLVHGSFFSGWCWLPVMERLSARGFRSRAVELPFTSLDDDVREVRREIDDSHRDGAAVLVVCHSYTGITVSLGGHAADGLVYIAARLPEPSTAPADESGEWNTPAFRACMKPTADGLVLTEEAEPLLFHRSPPDLARAAMDRRRPLRSVIPATAVTDPAWRSVPTTYVVCGDDRAVSVEAQRIRATRVEHAVELNSDHSPFFSAPDALTDVLVEAGRRTVRR